MRCMLEVSMKPAEGTSPEEPFIQVAHQHINICGTNFEQLEQSADLLAPLPGFDAQMRSHHLKLGFASLRFTIGRTPVSFALLLLMSRRITLG